MVVWLSDDDTYVGGEVICSGNPQKIRRIDWPLVLEIFCNCSMGCLQVS
jgi:hypothetical protein